MIEDTPEKIINQNFERIRKSAKKRTAHSYEFRIDQLKKLEAIFDKYESEIYRAKKADLGMGKTNTYLTGIFGIKAGKNNQKSQILSQI